MRARLIVNFGILSEAQFTERVTHIGGSLKTTTHFPGPWPAPIPSLESLLAEIAAFCTQYAAAKNHDVHAIATRNAMRATLTQHLQHAAAYFEVVANGNLAALQSTGYGITHDPIRSQSTDPPAAPQGVTFHRGPETGSAVLHAQSDPTANHWEAQVTNGDPSVEANWGQSTTSEHCNKIVFHNLTPLKPYYARLRGWNQHGWGPWTISSSLIVL